MHPKVIEWMWRMSKDLGGYLQNYDTGRQEAWLCWLLFKKFGHHLNLQIYDTQQQEAWLHWLLLKEFGHHLAYTLPKGMGMEEMW